MKQLLKSKKVKQKDLAKLLNLTEVTISKHSKNNYLSLTLSQVKLISKHLNTPLLILIDLIDRSYQISDSEKETNEIIKRLSKK